MASRLVLYGRPDCHLCDQARDGLRNLIAEGLPFDLEEVNIESDEELHARFLERIPVIELDGEFVSELGLDEGALRARLGTLSE
jgi:glutathione S-transferase